MKNSNQFSQINDATNTNKKKLIIYVIGLFILLTLAVGMSYAAWTYNFLGVKTNTISTTDVSLKFLESSEELINITNALPLTDNEGKEQEDTYNFAVTSKTTRDTNIEYNINIEKLSVDNGYTSLNDNQIKVYLTDYNNTQKVAPTLVSNLTNYKLYTGKHSHDATHETIQDKFKLRVWIDESVTEAAKSWTTSTKLQYKFKLGLTSEEKEKGSYPEVVYRYGTNNVRIGDPLETTNVQKYCPRRDGYDGCEDDWYYDTLEECQNDVDSNEYTCEIGQIQIGVGDYTEDYTTLNKNFFLKHNISSEGTVESSEVCYLLNSTLYCLNCGQTNYESNKQVLNASFGASNCHYRMDAETGAEDDYVVECSASGLNANVDANQYGYVDASDGSSRCFVSDDGYSSCYEM